MTSRVPEFLPFDLSAVRDWPEFRAVAQALDAFAQRAGREVELTQEECERALLALTRDLVASDCCPHCAAGEIVAPHAFRRDERHGYVGSYRCAHGHKWSTWWGSRGGIVEIG